MLWLRLLALLLVVGPLARTAAAQYARPPVPARHGLVVSDHVLASEAGRAVLQQGGNAVDAAIATAFALAVTFPAAGNIGGGGFLVFHAPDGAVTTIDFREKAPLAATERMYLGEDGFVRDNANHDGPLAVGVPGTVAGLWLAHQRYGSLPWEDLVEPAVRLAADGFDSTWYMHDWLTWLAGTSDETLAGTRDAFLVDGEQVYEPGAPFRQPDLARTLERIRDDGHDGFYRGETARLLAAFMAEHGGIITTEDLAAYEAVEREPVRGTYRGYDVYAMPPPSSGGVALVQMLNILEGYDLRAMGPESADFVHLVAEAARRAYADRAAFLGDPGFNPDLPLGRLTSKAYADVLRAGIGWYRAAQSDSTAFGTAFLPVESEQTTHLSVVDAEGGAVSLTYTLEQSYGSNLVAPGTGFLLNNEMGDFNAIPGYTDTRGRIGTAPNLIEPEKRMLSSMTPTIIARDGRPVLVIGSPGGRTIINTVLQVTLNVLDHEMNIAEAIAAPRFHHQWLPDALYLESFGFSPDTQRLLQMRGHELRVRPRQGAAMGIAIDPASGLRYGASDPRSFDGAAVGY